MAMHTAQHTAAHAVPMWQALIVPGMVFLAVLPGVIMRVLDIRKEGK